MRTIPAVALLAGCFPIFPTTTDSGTIPTTTTTDCAVAIVGPAGGAVALPDASVTFPAGVLAADTEVSLCPAVVADALVAWEVLPADLSLLGAAAVAVSHAGDDALARLFLPDGSGGGYRSLNAQSAGAGALEGPLYHGGVLWVAEDPRATDAFMAMADLLFVIDNTCSMADDHGALATTFSTLIPQMDLRPLDYHVGVVTTDIDDPDHSGRLREAAGVRWVEPTTPNPAQVFGAMADVGTNGSFSEAGFGAAYLAVEVEGAAYNAGFLREDATLAVVVLSDEADQTPRDLIGPASFTTWLEGQRPADEVALHAITDLFFGTNYTDMAAATGGHVADIADASGWLDLLTSVLDDASVGDTMTLPTGLDPASIEVWWVSSDFEQERIPEADVAYDAATGALTVTTTHPTAELVVVF